VQILWTIFGYHIFFLFIPLVVRAISRPRKICNGDMS